MTSTTEFTVKYKILEESVVDGKRLGRNVHHDSRSLNYLVEEADASTFVTKKYNRVTPVLDQGNTGSCTGNATCGVLGTGAFYTSLAQLLAIGLVLNEDEAVKIYSLATQLDSYAGTYPPTDTGSDGLSAAKAAQKLGLISAYNHATSLNAMISALQTSPVIVGTNWYDGMDNPDGNGLVHVTGSVRGGHEYEINGVDVENQLFNAINSWGPNWGVVGTFTISWSDMERLLGEEGDCTQFVPISSSTPTPPTPTDPDAALWAIAGPWTQVKRYRSDLVQLRQALMDWHNSK